MYCYLWVHYRILLLNNPKWSNLLNCSFMQSCRWPAECVFVSQRRAVKACVFQQILSESSWAGQDSQANDIIHEEGETVESAQAIAPQAVRGSGPAQSRRRWAAAAWERDNVWEAEVHTALSWLWQGYRTRSGNFSSFVFLSSFITPSLPLPTPSLLHPLKVIPSLSSCFRRLLRACSLSQSMTAFATSL